MEEYGGCLILEAVRNCSPLQLEHLPLGHAEFLFVLQSSVTLVLIQPKNACISLNPVEFIDM